ncbi:50S ribosomal protein L21 [Patescibacteria group bacterium]|nr:50S ribosomal protein L21 [Patescibacteria group bacterium]
MLTYAICEISGKQYKVVPNTSFEVARQEGDKDITASILLLSEDGKIKIGNPYLKDKLILKRVEDIKGPKIRVSKFHAKANFRKTIGYRSKLTKVVYSVKS